MLINEIVECALMSGYARTIVKVKVKKCQKSKSQNLSLLHHYIHLVAFFQDNLGKLAQVCIKRFRRSSMS